MRLQRSDPIERERAVGALELPLALLHHGGGLLEVQRRLPLLLVRQRFVFLTLLPLDIGHSD